jgi:electron transfer flavoprotein alpha subunit
MKMNSAPENANIFNIWILAQHRAGKMEDVTFGLLGEARRLLSQSSTEGSVTAVVLGYGLEKELGKLAGYGADRVLYSDSEFLRRYQGEFFSKVLCRLLRRDKPNCLLAAQAEETSDLCARVAALLETGLVTCAMDLTIDQQEGFVATRPVANGHIFEAVHLSSDPTPIVSFLPSVLAAAPIEKPGKGEIITEPVGEDPEACRTRVLKTIEADPETLDIEEADIIVAGGRGVGKEEAFDRIHELARLIGASVAATRPVIDWQTLPYERQIGQTGKTVTPRLIINCGISGANEYTAGMEKSRLVIAINNDPVARIFRFADLGVVADLHALLPLLIERILAEKDSASTDLTGGGEL